MISTAINLVKYINKTMIVKKERDVEGFLCLGFWVGVFFCCCWVLGVVVWGEGMASVNQISNFHME